MTLQQDLKKNWPKAKKQIEKLGKEALIVAEKGKKELIRFSHESKIRLDITSLELKKERLFYLIGKEFVKEHCPGNNSETLAKFIQELETVSQQQKSLQTEMEKKKTSG